MKKSIFSAVIAVILLAGCAPRENDGSSSSAESSQSSTAISSSSQSFSSSSSLSSSSVSESSGAAQSSEGTQSSSSASVQSSSSSTPIQSSSQSTPAQSSSSTPTQSSSQKPASSSTPVQSSSSKQTESKPAQLSSKPASSKPTTPTGNLAPENNPYPGYKYVEDPDAKGATVYGIKTNDPDQGTYKPTSTDGVVMDGNGFPDASENGNYRSNVFIDKNGVKWVYSAVTDWYIDGTEPDVSHGTGQGDGVGGQIPGAY